jgi:hypothetical protein
MQHTAQIRMDMAHYERADIVDTWLNAYEIEKERAFIKAIEA